jgi:hypothetical protein
MDTFRSHKAQLVLTAVAASLATFSLLTAYGSYHRKARRRSLNDDALRSVAENIEAENSKDNTSLPDHPCTNATSGYDEELMREQLARNYAFFGADGMSKVRAGSVVVVGCGGVGSWAAVMLVRSYVPMCLFDEWFPIVIICRGVSKIRLVDFDYVTLSSLNRHATAGIHDVGTPKVTCIERTLKAISRCVEVDSRIEIWRKEDGGRLLEGADWVIGERMPVIVYAQMKCYSKTRLIIYRPRSIYCNTVTTINSRRVVGDSHFLCCH